MLEVIDKGKTTLAHPAALLFVHGGCHAAWCWDEHFLDYFAERGFRAIAVSLRGHGKSSRPKHLNRCSITDYLADIGEVADLVDRPPVVIGHSTGGFLVQKYLETRRAPAGVLLASIPPRGALRLSMRLWRRHPWLSIRAYTFGEAQDIFNTPARARELLFCADTPEEIVASCAARVEPESIRAAFLGQIVGVPDPRRINIPILVLAGEDDGTITGDEVCETADCYHAEVEFFPKMGHNMMLEPGWCDVAARIRSWLGGLEL